jgi:hypothetical protein
MIDRPLPELNSPQPTLASDAPSPPAMVAEPPLVTRLDQVVPRASLSKVRLWLRRLRRSLRAAERGDLALAKRLRPHDLWLDACEHTVPSARGWVWDLRPLAVGQPAVPLQPSTGDGSAPPATDVRTDQLGVDDAEFSDQAIISEMRQGIADDSECRLGTLLCAPHASALQHIAVANCKLRASEEKLWATGGWELPCWPIRASPYGIVDESERAGEPKHRLTNDLSWPHLGAMPDGVGGFVDSVNGAMRRDFWPSNRLMRVHEVAASAATLEASEAPVELWGLDAKNYYRVIGRQRAELWRNAIVDERGFQLDERCCFGSAADATKCSRISNYLAWQTLKALQRVDAQYPPSDSRVIEWLARRRAAALSAGASEDEITERWCSLHAFGLYIDDAAAASISDLLTHYDGSPVMRDGQQLRRAQLHFEAARDVLVRFGFESAARKEQPPARRLVTLGVELDLDDNRMRVSDDKRRKYAARARSVAAMKSCPRDDMVALLSRLQFAASCYPLGRQWLHAPWRAVRAQWRLAGDNVLVTKAVRGSLHRWARELESDEHAGVPLASRAVKAVGAPGGGAIYADASGNGGFAAWTVSGGELFFVEDHWLPQEQPMVIAEKELLASTLGLVALAPAAGFDSVVSFTDNTVAQAAMRYSTPSTHIMQQLAHHRSEWLVSTGRIEAAARLTSKANLWADLGSRGQLHIVRRQAEAMGLTLRRVAIPAGWRELTWEASCLP